MIRIINKTGALLGGLALSLLSGCGSDAGTPSQGNGTEARYAVSTGVLVGDEFVGYLATVPSLDQTTTFNLDNAIEIEPSWIFGQEGKPYVYAASLFSPTIVRYSLSADGTLAEDDKVSFANFGLHGADQAASAPIYSEDKSYFVDPEQDQVVIWNPRLMQAIGTIALNDSNEGPLPPAPEGSIIIHNGMILTVIHWSDRNEDPSVYGSHVRLIVIDPKTDKVVSSTDDDRLSYAAPQGRASDGSLFYSPASFIASETEAGPGHGSPSRVLRLGPKATTFDDDFELDLSSLVGGRPAGDYTLLDDQTALIRAWHPELADPVTSDNWKDVLWTQAGFLWWRWHIGDAQAVQIPDQSPGALGSAVFGLDGKTYVMRTAEDSASTTLDQIDADGGFRPTLTGPGQFIGNSLVRVR